MKAADIQVAPSYQNRLELVVKTILVLTTIAFTALAVANPSAEIIRNFLIFGLIASVIVGCLFLPKGPIQGPFGLLWKSITGISLFYLCMLIYLFFKQRTEAMNFISSYIDPKLNFMDYEEVSYGQNCQLISHSHKETLTNLYNSCFDLFALAHFLGWFFKTLICRDIKLIFFASVSFELIEYSLRNVLNNFKECWWDHVMIDIFGCNLLGIAIGFLVIDKFGLDRYRWSLRSAPLQYSHWENFKKFWTRWDLSYLQTKTFATLRPFLKMVYFIVLFQANDLTLFFLKYIYHVPPSHFLCIGRVWVVGLLCVNAAREYYDFLKHRTKFRKINCVLLNAIVFIELAIVLKQGENKFQHAYIDNLGIFFLGSLAAMFLVLFVKIGVSDILRKVRGVIDAKQRKKQLQKEYAKLIKQE